MSEVTLEAITKLLEDKFEEKLEPINIKLLAIEKIVSGHTETINNIQTTVNSHTTSLDGIANDVRRLTDAQKVNGERFDKNEKAVKFVAEKVGVTEEVKQIFQA